MDLNKFLFLTYLVFLLSCDGSKQNRSDHNELNYPWQSYSVDCDQVRAYLESAYDRDQGVRNGEIEGNMQDIDFANEELLISIFQCCGQEKIVSAGDKATQAAFLITQHAPLSFQLEYIHTFEHWSKEGIIRPSTFALMIDRTLMYQNKPQLYGTQVSSVDGGEMKLYEVDDIKRVHQRRDSLSMEPLEDYLKRFDVVLDSI